MLNPRTSLYDPENWTPGPFAYSKHVSTLLYGSDAYYVSPQMLIDLAHNVQRQIARLWESRCGQGHGAAQSRAPGSETVRGRLTVGPPGHLQRQGCHSRGASGVSDKHLRAYLPEICYRFNRRFWEIELFDRLVKACVITGTVTYHQLTKLLPASSR